MMINHCVLNLPCGSTNELFKSEQQNCPFFLYMDKEMLVPYIWRQRSKQESHFPFISSLLFSSVASFRWRKKKQWSNLNEATFCLCINMSILCVSFFLFTLLTFMNCACTAWTGCQALPCSYKLPIENAKLSIVCRQQFWWSISIMGLKYYNYSI